MITMFLCSFDFSCLLKHITDIYEFLTRMTAEDIDGARAALAQAITTATDIQGPFENLLNIDVPLDDKFRILKFPQLLRQNAQVILWIMLVFFCKI